MKINLNLLGLIFLLLCFVSCEDENNESDINISNIKGLVEKGPFVSGSSVSVYELDNNLHPTGRVFEAKTNDEGAFSINPSTSFVSKYVKLSVNGFYFNEHTGELSNAPIVMEAITSIENTDNTIVNVNTLTHLELPRITQLITTGKSFQEAKTQVQKELLAGFLIKDKTIIPEETSITGNDTAAEILIAISSILLNGRSDAQLTEFMSTLRDDLVDGEVSVETKKKISDSSFRLSYSGIKENIKNRYQELGKTVEVGNFELFIDGDGDGEIGDSYEEDIPNTIPVEEFFTSEENVKLFYTASMMQLSSFIQTQYLFDGIYTNTVDRSKLNPYYNLISIYEHNIIPSTSIINDMWGAAYKSIRFDNSFIEKAAKYNFDWLEKYLYYAKVYRTYKYLVMTNLWGDVPLIKTTELSSAYIGRNPQNEIIDFIISEIDGVYNNLPENSSQFGCSKYFAKAIQARAYLYKKDYTKALECVHIIINSGKYSLSSDINSIYAGNNKENLLEIPDTDDLAMTSFRELIKKGNYIAPIRYAELLLIASEANMNLGNQTQAMNYLNQVRIRNGRTQLNNSSELEDALLNEWKADLKNEGVYFSTLKRFNKAKQILNIADYKLLLPIPRSEVDLNPEMKQNPGY